MINFFDITPNYLESYKVDDVINKDSKILFILESPHTQEMKYSYPVAGTSGKDMTKFIYGEQSSDAFGKIISQLAKYSDKYSDLDKFSILNVSSAPMQKDGLKAYQLSNDEELLIDILEKLRVNYKSKSHKNKNWNQVKSILLDNFKQRLLIVLENSPSIEYLVPCGRFASSYLNLIKYFEEIISKKKIVQNIPHPSFNQWSRDHSMNKLDEVLEKVVVRNF